jgi:hypothetical protein
MEIISMALELKILMIFYLLLFLFIFVGRWSEKMELLSFCQFFSYLGILISWTIFLNKQLGEGSVNSLITAFVFTFLSFLFLNELDSWWTRPKVKLRKLGLL